MKLYRVDDGEQVDVTDLVNRELGIHKREWWMLTGEEVARCNPPPDIYVFDEDDNLYRMEVYQPGWQPVGHIPTPTTWLGWFMYHMIHGLAMRYPLHKVVGFALANSRPGEPVLIDIGELTGDGQKESPAG